MFTQASINRNVGRLTNQLWKLIPMRENGEDWMKQLESVIIEIEGMQRYCPDEDDRIFLIILSKLKGILVADIEISFEVYRKTVFESISNLQEIKKYG